MGRFDLKNTTFIIPLRIDSSDREYNFSYVIQHLCNVIDTNILIYESDTSPKGKNILDKINIQGCNIFYDFEQSFEPVFHRTRILNVMLSKVKTPVVVNYDTDVFTDGIHYYEAQEKILKEGYDLVYPYFEGKSQYKLNRHDNTTILWDNKYGMCQFFNTNSYREGGMENENFISWGPEDEERMHRFITLGYKVTWMNNYIFHLEHTRDNNSSQNNPFFHNNIILWGVLKYMNKESLVKYYKDQEYLKKYK